MAAGRLQGTAVIAQSGGPTAVINQSLVGCVETLREAGVERILGARHAVRGIVDDDYVDFAHLSRLVTRPLTPERLERIANTPSSALGTCRDKPDEEYCERILASFARHEVRSFFYIGGNDSSDTCRIVNSVARARNYELACFHVPKTIDNDLEENDHTPGYGSAARFVACAVAGDDLDNRALPGIKIDIIMGRHAGFLTAASRLARRQEDDGPHLIYVPEVAFDVDKFIADVDRCFSRLGRCVIASSEGIHNAEGTAIAALLSDDVEKDAHGNVQLSGSGALGDHLAGLIRKHLGNKLRVRADTFGYLQRSFAGCVSAVDQAEARGVGRHAVEQALSGKREGSIVIRRESDDPYRAVFGCVPLESVAARTRTLPLEYIVDGCDIAASFVDYLSPLTGEMPVIETL